MTNREFYVFVAELVAGKKNSQRSLEDYLRCVLHLATAWQEAPGLDAASFATLLERAFVEPVAGAPPSPAGDFAVLADLLRRQIRDLADMAAAGTLADEMRYFGANAPSGHRWYNFDPCTFIECAVAGTFGGWREGDPTARVIVPGEVAVIDEDGRLRAADPHSLEDPIEELGQLSWEHIVRFFTMGQVYE